MSSLGMRWPGVCAAPDLYPVEESMSYDTHDWSSIIPDEGVIDLELLDDAIEEMRSSRSPSVRVQQLLVYIEDLHQLIVRNDENELKIERRKLR